MSSNPIIQPSGITVAPFVKFDPSKEYGFKIDNFISRKATSDYRNLSYLSARDASNLFHNFYGLTTDISVTHTIPLAGGANNEAKFPESIDYQTLSPPESRYSGGQVYQASTSPRQSVTYLGGSANLFSVTNQMNKFYSNDQFTPEAFLGFGQVLFNCTLRGRTSRYGGTVDHYLLIASYQLDARYLPIGHYRETIDGVSTLLNAFDGTYKAYLNQLEYIDPRLKPELKASINYGSFTLSDGRGNNISLKTTEAKVEQTDFTPRYREDEETGESYVVGVDALEPPKTKLDVTGSKFYQYSAQNTSYLEPNNYLI